MNALINHWLDSLRCFTKEAKIEIKETLVNHVGAVLGFDQGKPFTANQNIPIGLLLIALFIMNWAIAIRPRNEFCENSCFQDIAEASRELTPKRLANSNTGRLSEIKDFERFIDIPRKSHSFKYCSAIPLLKITRSSPNISYSVFQLRKDL